MYTRYLYGLLIALTFVFTLSAQAQNVSSDELLKQAIYETNVSKNYPRAISLARAGLKASPDYTDIRLLLGRLYLLTDQYEEGNAELRKVLLKDPRNKDALNYLMNSAFERKLYDDALMYSSRYLSFYPSDRPAILKRAGIYSEKKEYKMALDEIGPALEKYPQDQSIKNAYLEYALAYASQLRINNDIESAVNLYERLLTIDPANKDVLNALFNLNVQLGRNDRALLNAEALQRLGTGPEILLKKADLLRTMRRYDEASIAAEELLNKRPDDSTFVTLFKDIQFAQGKYRMESGDTTNALRNYESVLARYPSDTLARNLVININLERKNYPLAMTYIDSGVRYYGDPTSLYARKLQLLQSTGEIRDAYVLADSLATHTRSNSMIDSIRDVLFVKTRQNRIGLSSSITMFDQEGRDPWTLHSLSYLREEKKISFGGRINYADRVNFRGYQFELEAYPRHGKTYSFINAAYSESMVFPKFKFSYSYFMPIGQNWESEIGFRYLHGSSDFKGFTGALGRYFNRYWANLKTFQTSSNGKLVGSYIFTNRYYLSENPDDYLSAIAGYGFSPEDVARNFDFIDRVNLESLRFTLGYQNTIWKRAIGGVFGTWNKQEYTPGKKRNEFDISISLQYKF